MSMEKTKNRNPDTIAIESALIEKFGAEEFAAARARAKFKAEIASVIKQRRMDLDMDQKDMAKKLKTTQQQLSRYEVGENSPTMERIFDIFKVLGLELIVRERDKGKELIHI